MRKHNFSSKEIQCVFSISAISTISINIALEEYIAFWTLVLIPIITLLHTIPRWKTGIYSILSLTTIQMITELIVTNKVGITPNLIEELMINSVTNTALILVVTYFSIKNSNIQSKLEGITYTDPLTKAYNRRFFDHFMSEESNVENLTIQLIDIDHFKNVNDTYGHPCGDYILTELVEVLKKDIRKMDKIVRLGGEEFAILCPETDRKEGQNIGERMCRLVENTTFRYDSQIIPITISIGLATNREKVETNTLMNEADKALYKAKQNGRNQVAFDF